jgi:hypothetical protein
LKPTPGVVRRAKIHGASLFAPGLCQTTDFSQTIKTVTSNKTMEWRIYTGLLTPLTLHRIIYKHFTCFDAPNWSFSKSAVQE